MELFAIMFLLSFLFQKMIPDDRQHLTDLWMYLYVLQSLVDYQFKFLGVNTVREGEHMSCNWPYNERIWLSQNRDFHILIFTKNACRSSLYTLNDSSERLRGKCLFSIHVQLISTHFVILLCLSNSYFPFVT